MLSMSDGRGIPISTGGVLSGNHNDHYEMDPQYVKMVSHLRRCGICVENSMQNMDKGFDSKSFRRAIQRRKMIPNVKKYTRNRKMVKKGRKRFFDPQVYKERFVNERCFAWIDSFRTFLVRFDKFDKHWMNWHYLAFAFILLKV